MNRERILSLLFLLPALLLLLAPADTLRNWRLQVHSLLHNQLKTYLPESSATLPDESAPAANMSEDEAARMQALKLRLVQMESDVAALRIELRNLTDLRNRLPKTHFYPAKVIKFEPGDPPAGVYLDAGKDVGVKEGDGLAVGYVFAGTITQVAQDASFALLPSSIGSFIPARTEKARDTCAIKADGKGGAIAIFYSGKTTAKIGEYLLTSGLLGRIPEGLVIGKLEEFPHRGSEPGTLEAPVRLEFDLSRLYDVAVISQQGTGQ